MGYHEGDLNFLKFDNSSKVVLIIDDDPSIRTSIAAYLEDNSFAILTASTGTEGINLARTKRPDIILLDMRLPDYNGLQVLEKFSESEISVPVIVITGQVSMDDAVLALKTGAWDYLVKPLNFNRLQHSMTVCFEKNELLRRESEHLKKLEKTNQKLILAVNESKKIQEELKKANKIKSEFLAKISNELKIPTLGVESIIDILLDTELSEQQMNYARIIQSNITSLGSSIDKLVDFSKLETNRLSLKAVHFDLSSMINDVIFRFKKFIDTDYVKFSKNLETSVPKFLIGDPWHLGQLLSILLENAFKFTPQGSVSLNVSTTLQNEHSVTLKFDITDTGIGISQDVLKGLFEEFHKSDDGFVQYSGLGLGLALSKKLAAFMGGQIGIGSTVGKGTSFWFTVTIVKQPENSHRDDTGIGKDILPANFFASRRLKILLSDNNDNAQMIAGAFFNRLGCSYKVADNDTLTLEMLESEQFDLMILNLHMMGMSGFEIAGIVRSPMSAVLNHNIPIIGTGDREDYNIQERCVKAGINAYIPRPYTFTQLAVAIENVVSHKEETIYI
ncbi:MAG: response regulator [Deltaproteobacteria bacterium]|nr:response regulator [Deltaproteobacteria bacterium]